MKLPLLRNSCSCPPSSASLIPLFLTCPWMSDGSNDLLLYQHRARCTMGAYSLAFICTGSRDVSVFCVCVCIWVSESTLQVHECEYVCICVLASACVCRGIRSQSLSLGTLGPALQRAARVCYASMPAKVGNPVYVAGAALAGQVANARVWHLHVLPPPMQAQILDRAVMHNAALHSKIHLFKEDSLSALNSDLKLLNR